MDAIKRFAVQCEHSEAESHNLAYVLTTLELAALQ